jgi:hypothetical protein
MLEFLISVFKISYKFRLKVGNLLFRNDFKASYQEKVVAEFQNLFEVNFILLRKVVNKLVQWFMELELEFVLQEMVENSIIWFFKGKFEVKKVSKIGVKQLLIFTVEAIGVFLRENSPGLNLDFPLCGKCIDSSILFTPFEKVMFNQKFNLSYSYYNDSYRYTGTIRFESEFNQDEKDLIRENLMLNNNLLDQFHVIKMDSYYIIRRKSELRGGMDQVSDFADQFEFGFEEPGMMLEYMGMMDESMFEDEGFVMKVVERVENIANLQHFEMNMDETVARIYAEENARISREDQRHNEDILREDNIAVINAHVQVIVERLGILAEETVNVANSSITWDRNQPFEVFKGVFTLLVEGWKQTLVTAFGDRDLRLEVYKNMVMRYEFDSCKYHNFFNTF